MFEATAHTPTTTGLHAKPSMTSQEIAEMSAVAMTA